MKGLLTIKAIGHLGSDPAMGTMPSGDDVANFRIAVSDDYKDSNGEFIERTEWFKCHAFGDLAKVIDSLCKKGTQVYIEAGYKASQWTDKRNVEHEGFELRIQKILVLNNGKNKE